MSTLKLYDLAPSPNSMKARIALAYKNLPYEKIAVNPQERAEVIRVSGQPLTPVLVHGETVVYDSAAILRYLDANFRATPRLFSDNYDAMKAVERWERAARHEISEPLSLVFGQYFAEKKDEAVSKRASALLHERTAAVEEQLGKTPFLAGEAMTAADVTAAPYIFYGMLPPEAAKSGPVAEFFLKNLALGEGRARTREWVSRVMNFDK